MGLLQTWYPPTRENWETLVSVWQIAVPVLGNLQWVIGWYGMGKTSVASRLNLPGRIAWFTMEAPGFLTLLYIMKTMPQQYGITDLPWQNKVLAGLFVIHYSYRAVIFPYIQPSMSPIHILVWLFALTFQLCNATSIGCWLAAYGPTTAEAWSLTGPLPTARFVLGIIVFYLGLSGNFFHDEELREIRRAERRRQERLRRQQKGGGSSSEAQRGGGVEKHYRVPEAGLFRWILYPHYLCEWVEWAGFWIAGGWACVPARAFLFNEIATMVPRAVRGRWWYLERFGEEKVGKKWAVLPGVY
ncbi:related to steroid 5 alpha-reductase [Cephalotrichum gorgonifer]|uniref:Related to steroid 5 alpha-reductase n=1 Tax=Cephalotrichum gorgonifer TaxID=2041049 RepID=A0AAE8N0V0_9PEZI|nr:related to steroid 5 alpha-reductase [Cephalotrichum gorgonifer]